MTLRAGHHARLTPGRVRSVSFRLARLGRRGFDEDDVRDFCDRVEGELSLLLEERTALQAEVRAAARLGPGHQPATCPAGPAAGCCAIRCPAAGCRATGSWPIGKRAARCGAAGYGAAECPGRPPGSQPAIRATGSASVAAGRRQRPGPAHSGQGPADGRALRVRCSRLQPGSRARGPAPPRQDPGRGQHQGHGHARARPPGGAQEQPHPGHRPRPPARPPARADPCSTRLRRSRGPLSHGHPGLPGPAPS